MKKKFIEELVIAKKRNDNIVLIVNDLGYGMIEPFQKLFSNSVFNAGVSEQSMMGYAAGLAATGKHVFVYSIANFNTFRCAEQIRNDVDYHKLPVTIVSAGAGVGYGNLGYSHHAIQDYSLIRSFPNMIVASPGDIIELKACMNYLTSNPQPSYLRLDKSSNFQIHKKNIKITPGKWIKVFDQIKKNKKKEIYLSTGSVIEYLVDKIKNRKIKNRPLYSLPLWGMKSKSLQKKIIKKYDKIYVVEDHLQDGGFQSWLNESNNNSKLISKSLSQQVIEEVGSQNFLMRNMK